MVDLAGPEFREPIEVYLAAVGEVQPLVQRLRSEVVIGGWERSALALLLLGELVPAKKSQGGNWPSHVGVPGEISEEMKLQNAEFLYRHWMETLRSEGAAYGVSAEILDAVASHIGVDIERLNNRIRRSKRRICPDVSKPTAGVVHRFQSWHFLHERGLAEHWYKGVYAAEKC